MKKVLLLGFVTLELLFMVNCSRTSFEKAQLGHWKGQIKGEEGEFFISTDKIYVLIDEKIYDIIHYTIKSENKKAGKKVLKSENEGWRNYLSENVIKWDSETEFTFSDHYKTLTMIYKPFPRISNKFILTFVDNIQKPSEKLITPYQKRRKYLKNESNLESISKGLDMYADSNGDEYPNDTTPAAKDHILIKEGYINRAITDPITGKDYTFKLKKYHYIVSCPNPEKYGYKEIYYDSEHGVIGKKLGTQTKSNLTVIDYKFGTAEFGRKVIVGTLKNNSDKQYSFVQVQFNLYDESGAQVGSTIDVVHNFEPHGTWKFEAPVTEDNATRVKLKGVDGHY